MTILVSLITGFVGGFVAWFCTNFFLRPIEDFLKLRSETQRSLYYYANINFDRPPNSRNADDAQKCFRSLGAQLDALRTSSPRTISLFVWRRYDLESAATGLTGLSNTLTPGSEEAATKFRVQAQRALGLPVDPEDQETVDRAARLAGQLI